MSCTTTTAMYLGVSTDICASATASRSGNTVTVSGTFSVTQSGSWNYNAIYAYVDGQTSWTRVKPYQASGGSWSANFSFSFTDSSSGTRSYTAIFQVWNNAESGTVGDPASVNFSVSYPSGATVPSGLACSNISSTYDTVTATVSVTGWGGTGDASTRYRNLSVLQTSDKPTSTRRYQRAYGNTMSSAITVDNNTQYGTMTIVPNTRYWLWWYATNGTYGTDSPNPSTTTVVTLAKPASITISSISTSASFNYSIEADGGFYAKTYQYSVDGGTTWVTFATVSSGSATSGSFTVSGVTAGTAYVLKTRVTTTAGTSNGEDITFSTLIKNKVYGSVSGNTRTVLRLYGSVNGQSRKINKLYGSAGGESKIIYQGFGHLNYN